MNLKVKTYPDLDILDFQGDANIHITDININHITYTVGVRNN